MQVGFSEVHVITLLVQHRLSNYNTCEITYKVQLVYLTPHVGGIRIVAVNNAETKPWICVSECSDCRLHKCNALRWYRVGA